MLFASSKTWMSILLACNSMLSVQAAPTSAVERIFARDMVSPPAIIPALTTVNTREVSDVITARDAVPDVALAKRYLIGSPYQKRIIELSLKKAVHGLAAGTTWLWEISYAYSTRNGGKEGYVHGNLVKGDGSFAFGPFRISESFVNSVDGIVTATFNAVIERTSQKIGLTLTWNEDFKATSASLENHGTSSSTIYYSPGGSQEHLSQDFFSYAIREA